MRALISWTRRLLVWQDSGFNQFEDCGGFRKQPGKGKGEAKLIVNSEKKGTMNYNAKEEILKVNFFMDTGIRHWIEDARWNQRVTSISLIVKMKYHVDKNLSTWTITKKERMPTWIIASIPYFPLRTYVSRKHPYLLFPQLALSQILLGSLLPLLTLELINLANFAISPILCKLLTSDVIHKKYI